MTSSRFDFQRGCAARVSGRVLNVGCKEDPAGLKSNFGDRVTNLDIREEDEDKLVNQGVHVRIPVDVVHDATVSPWPFADDTFDLVVIGDLLEDLPDDGCQLTVLEEARRVGKHLCVTTPEDSPERDAHHRTTVTQAILQMWLYESDWEPVEFNIVDYGFVPRGYFVFAERGDVCAATSSSTDTTPVSSAPPSPSSPEETSPTPESDWTTRPA